MKATIIKNDNYNVLIIKEISYSYSLQIKWNEENLILALFCENTNLGDKDSSQLWFYFSYLNYLSCIIHPHSLEFHKYFFFSFATCN